jgi:predicted metal-dependent peptidase
MLEMQDDPSKDPDAGGSGDVLSAAIEREMFPGDSDDQETRAKAMQEAAERGLNLAGILDALKAARGKGADAGTTSQRIAALRGLYRIPWETAVQRWLESVAPGERTFTRPSRRGQQAPDVVLPGRKREGWILNIVLDTSGSMTDEIPRALGAIADICDALAVDQVRLVQCDTAVTGETFLSPSELAEHEITGFGGSDLSPALLHLAEDDRVTAVVVITDGEITYPEVTMPYRVLWLLSANASGSFSPPYGKVIPMQLAG